MFETETEEEGGIKEIIFSVLKVPRQYPLVLLVGAEAYDQD
jgi:hypothetical protein